MTENQMWDNIKAHAISKNFTLEEWERKRAALYHALEQVYKAYGEKNGGNHDSR